MARTPRGSGRSRRPARPTPARKPRPAASTATEPPRPAPVGPLRLGAIPGATPGKWIGLWEKRMPETELVLVPLEVRTQRDALDAGEVDAVLARLPLAGDPDSVHVIPLYDEVPVVVMAAESSLSVADELAPADLAGEVLVRSAQDVLEMPAAANVTEAAFPPLPTTADAIATVASGIGIALMPMSLARAHQRRDATHRPLRDGPTSTVALVWRRDADSPSIQTFVGIVRGRTVNSSR